MYRRAAIDGALVPLALSLLTAAAWITGFLRLASVHAEYIPMAPSTAIGFALLSATLMGLAYGATAVTRNAARAVAGLIAVLAVIKLVEFFTGAAALNLEATLVARPGEFGTVPLARMSPLTAVGFLLVSFAVGGLATAPNGKRCLAKAQPSISRCPASPPQRQAARSAWEWKVQSMPITSIVAGVFEEARRWR
jgi:hypothetical protein